MAHNLPVPGEVVCVEVDEIQPGPQRRKKLDPLLDLWARQLFERVGSFVVPTWRQWELGFPCDANPVFELFVWECVAQAYEKFLAAHLDCDKAAVALDLSLSTMYENSKGRTDHHDELQAIYRETWQRMNADRPKFETEVFRALARWPYRQLLMWDDLYREKP